jgi:glycolate oxidase FAD binding subunit
LKLFHDPDLDIVDMNTDHTALAKSLEAIVGGDDLIENSWLKIDALTPSFVIKPESTEQVCQCLKVCAEFRATVIPAGAMTWLECGNPLQAADVVLSLERMNRVIEYSPPDLTAIVEAGLSLQEFNRLTKRDGQWLPLDSAGSMDSTLGAIAATAASGALRLGFGTPRDYVIGLRLAHIDGTESKSGGRVAKNVAGYDLNKLYVGSFGTLAVITQLNLKLRPLPERQATMLITARKSSRLLDLARRVFSSAVQPASLFITARRPEVTSEDALLIRFIESEAAVEYQLNAVASMLDEDFRAATLSDEEAEKVWQQAVKVDELADNAVRVSVPLSLVTEFFQKLLEMHKAYFASADLGVGVIRLSFEAERSRAVELIKAMRAEAADVGGTLFIERAPSLVREEAEAWGEVGNLGVLMKGLKRNFDPQSLLNTGRFVAGI